MYDQKGVRKGLALHKCHTLTRMIRRGPDTRALKMPTGPLSLAMESTWRWRRYRDTIPSPPPPRKAFAQARPRVAALTVPPAPKEILGLDSS
jgi:hypothetical protein